MSPREDEFGLRLAAKASDRAKAAEQERQAFEERLRQLGYAPRAIAHAFSSLSGPGTVDEALEVLKAMSRPESPPIALSFEVTETRGGPSAADGVTITSVERDDFGIRVNYDSVPPLGFGSDGPRGEAKDDRGNDYDNLGCHFGLAILRRACALPRQASRNPGSGIRIEDLLDEDLVLPVVAESYV